MEETIFTKIINRQIPADIVYEDELSLAFRDINAKAPMHILVIPKKPITQLSAAEPADAPLLAHLLNVASQVAAKEGYANAFRLVINNGAAVGQTVFHLHLHVLGGRDFMWPPG